LLAAGPQRSFHLFGRLKRQSNYKSRGVWSAR
jgi:hypothetical protein